MRRPLLAVLVPAALVAPALAARADGFVYRKVADDTTEVGGATLTSFGAPELSGGKVAFLATDSTGRTGLYLATGSAVVRVVREGDPTAPGNPLSPTFEAFASFDVSGSSVAFDATVRLSSGQPQFGLYRVDGPAVTFVKGGVNFGVSLSGANVASVYQDGFTQTLTVTGQDTRTAGPHLTRPDASNGTGGFYGDSLTLEGTTVTYALQQVTNFVVSPSIHVGTSGTSKVIAGADTEVAGFAGGKFGYFSGVRAAGGSVAFVGATRALDARGEPVNSGVILFSGNSFRRIADHHTTVPGTTAKFRDFGRPGVSGDTVAFAASAQGRLGVWYHDGRKLAKVAGPGSRIDGKLVADPDRPPPGFEFLNEAVAFGDLDGRTIAFSVVFEDGSRGVYTATPAGGSGGIVVNSSGDGPDTDPGDGVATTGALTPDGEPETTLRAAMMEADATALRDTIAFRLPGDGPHVIEPASPLPAMTRPVVLDGTTQPGYAGEPVVVLDGRSAGAGAAGIELRGGKSTVRGLAVLGFDGSGVLLTGKGGHVVEACRVGFDGSGATSRGNGVGISVRSNGNTVGGAAPSARNVVSNNARAGIEVAGRSNRVTGNYVGTTPDGTGRLGNGVGVEVTGVQQRIGGDEPGRGNLVSGNGEAGIRVRSDDGRTLSGVRIEGNRVGTDAGGDGAIPNGVGIVLEDVSAAVVGGLRAGSRNVVSGNAGDGIAVTGFESRTVLVLGNYVGTNADGDAALANGGAGVVLSDGELHAVGGRKAGAGNVISANRDGGVRVSNCAEVTVQGNFVGLNAAGNAPLGNDGDGVRVVGGRRITIGGDQNGVDNVVSASGRSGIRLEGGTLEAVVRRNLVGTDLTTLAAFANGEAGIHVVDATDARIGGAPGRFGAVGNVVSGNTVGIHVDRGPGTVIQGNDIGTTLLDGPQPNGTGLTCADGAGPVLVGGTRAGEGNTIAFNLAFGVALDAAANPRVALQRNSIHGSAAAFGYLGGEGPPPPVLDAFTPDAAGRKAFVAGRLNARAETLYRVEFFRNDAPAVAGQVYLGFRTCETDASGAAEFRVAVPRDARNVTATATEIGRGPVATSRFSNVLAEPGPPPLKR